MKTITVDARMAKRVRESDYSQDRRGNCLICRTQQFVLCEHSWADVDKVCRIVRDIDRGPRIKVAF